MTSILVGLLALSILTAVLALLLEVADSYFGFYGECQITINEGDRKLDVQGGNKLLGTLMDEGIFVPSACGGRGTCGLCKVKILEGGGPLLPTEEPYLEPEEREDNVRLSCQVKVRSDMKIEIPPELFLIKSFKAKVTGLRDLTATIKELNLQLIEPETIEFKAGQFIQFEIPEYEGCEEPVYRAYSVASATSAPNGISLIITRVPEGVATTYIHDFLKEGDEVVFNGPYGEFYLRDSDNDIYLVATGSGLAPIMSMLYQIVDQKIDRKVTVVFGARHLEDLMYMNEIKQLQERTSNIEFIPTLSKPPESDGWQGSTGRVTDVLDKIVETGDNKEVYICGNPMMVESVEELFKKKGVPENLIYYDKFG